MYPKKCRACQVRRGLPELSIRRFKGIKAYGIYLPIFYVDDDQSNWYVSVIYVILLLTSSEATKFWRPTSEQLLISQEPKRKAFETDDGVITVTTAKRRRKWSSEGANSKAKSGARRDFLAKLTYASKSTRKMLSLTVNQGQLLFNSFSSILPCAIVCNILPRNSLVFDTARSGSVQDLLKLFEGGDANIHDHDTYGWSLLHVSFLQSTYALVINLFFFDAALSGKPPCSEVPD